MGMVMGVMGPLTKGSSSKSLSVNPWSSSGGVGVLSSHLGEGVNSTTSEPFRVVSFMWGCSLAGFPPGTGSPVLIGWLVRHSAAR